MNRQDGEEWNEDDAYRQHRAHQTKNAWVSFCAARRLAERILIDIFFLCASCIGTETFSVRWRALCVAPLRLSVWHRREYAAWYAHVTVFFASVGYLALFGGLSWYLGVARVSLSALHPCINGSNSCREGYSCE